MTETLNTPLEITLPSGALYPDWSCVTSPVARAALEAVFRVEQIERRWAGLGDDGERVRRAVLAGYLATGHAPSLGELGESTGLDPVSLDSQLADLARRDIIITSGDDGAIAGTYPFVEHSRGHRLQINGVEINAMCAIDALGAGAMCDTDAVIDSACTQCGAPIHVETRDRGASLAAVIPHSAVVRVGIEYEAGCAADSLCRVISYFCSDEHLNAWCAANPADCESFRLAMDEALQTGKAIFAPLMKDSPHER